MNDALAIKVLQKYGYEYRRLLPEQKGYRNKCRPVELTNGTTINVILFKSEPHILTVIKNADYVSESLANYGLPIRKPINQVVELHFKNSTRYARAYTYLPGETIAWEAYTMDHLKVLGKTMSDMHSVLQKLPATSLPSVDKINTQLHSKVESYFDDPIVAKAIAVKLNIRLTIKKQYMLDIFNICSQLPNQQVLHMDFVRSNILFTNQPSGDLKFSISGVLDFEKTAFGHPVFDIARTLAFLLVDCKYKTQRQIYKYFLHSGYNKRGDSNFINIIVKQNKQRINVLEELINWFLLYDFYKFLKHAPYESLLQNQHFLRTRDILITRKLIKYI